MHDKNMTVSVFNIQSKHKYSKGSIFTPFQLSLSPVAGCNNPYCFQELDGAISTKTPIKVNAQQSSTATL